MKKEDQKKSIITIKTIANPESYNFETDRSLYYLRLFIMWILTLWVASKKIILSVFDLKPKINTIWFDGISPLCREVKENAFTWRALDIVYNFTPKNSTLVDKINNFWNKMLTTQATRNRLKLVKYLLKKSIKEIHSRGEEVRLLSIASGSAQGVIEVLSWTKEKNLNVKALLLDLSADALNHSKKLAQELGVSDKIITVNKSTTDLELVAREFQPNLVEMVGFLEYRPYEKAVKLLSRIRKILKPKGTLIVSQIAPNPERYFLSVVINWPMIYRNVFDFSKIIKEAGFIPNRCQIIYEPMKIHSIAVCKKE